MESENHCTSQMRLLIDQISMQQGRILSLEGTLCVPNLYFYFYLYFPFIVCTFAVKVYGTSVWELSVWSIVVNLVCIYSFPPTMIKSILPSNSVNIYEGRCYWLFAMFSVLPSLFCDTCGTELVFQFLGPLRLIQPTLVSCIYRLPH